MDIFYTVWDLVGGLIQAAGLLAFGVAMGWLILSTLHRVDSHWIVPVLVFFILFAFVGVFTWLVSPTALGAFTLGVGGGLLFWGLYKPGKKADAAPGVSAEAAESEEKQD
ncbi:MAG: hypothetical protein ABFD44_15020 [Anaerolineaceae bacterium]